MVDTVTKIMVELLNIIGIASKEIKQSRMNMSLLYKEVPHMSLRRILGWQKGLVVMTSLRAQHGSSKSSLGLERVPRVTLAGTARGSAASGCAGHKDRDGKHNPTPHSRSPRLQPAYLRSRLGSPG